MKDERAFSDRRAAGRALGDHLVRTGVAGGEPLVLALPRGGVPVAAEVARALAARLDVLVVRKLGVPGHEELAMGALAAGGVRVLDERVVREAGVDLEELDAVTARERAELERREAAYRAGRAALALDGRGVVVVDDGLATGSTMRAAVRALGETAARAVTVAVPVAPGATCSALEELADIVVCLRTPEPFVAVGAWYRDFAPVDDDEVRALLTG